LAPGVNCLKESWLTQGSEEPELCYDLLTFHYWSTSLHTDASGTATPDAFGPFRVLHQIGAGALGPIFRAYDPDQDKLVAVKWFRIDLVPERTHRLVAELEQVIAANLSHPAIASPVATGIVGACAYLAQDFVASDTVDMFIRHNGSGPSADTLRVASGVAGAIDAAAAADVVHGAIHPRDIFVSPDAVRVSGFGIARALERAGQAAPVRRPYTAPERAATVSWDKRADIFSLAALLHEWLCAKRMTGIGQQAAEALTDLPGADMASLRTLFARALAERADERFETAHEFVEGVKQALANATTEKAPAAVRKSAAASVAARPARPEATRLVEHEPRLPLDGPELLPEVAMAAPAEAVSADFDMRGTAEVNNENAVESRGKYDSMVPVPLGNSEFDAARSAVWPLGLALVIGVSVGFGGGYAVATLQRPVGEPAETGQPAAVTAAATSGISARDFTENAVREPDATVPGTDIELKAPEPKPEVPVAVPAPPRVVAPAAAVRKPAATRAAVAAPRAARARPAVPARATPAAVKPPAPAPPTTVALTVVSRPAGANVFLDGTLIGQTPLQIGARTGDHAIRLERDGYRNWSSPVRLAAGATNRIAASLER
jgi:hypothetical protein